MKKLLYVLLSLVLVFSLAACANTEQSATTPAPAPATTDSSSAGTPAPTTAPATPSTPAEDPDTVNVILWANGAPPSADAQARVNDAINAITIPEINVKVNLQVWDVGTYIGTAATSVGAGDPIDLMCTFPAAAPYFANMASQGMLMPLNDLLQQYGQGIMSLIPQSWWAATTQNKQILGVPLYADKAYDFGIMFVKSWLDETGYKPEDIKTIDDIYNVLKAFQAKHPDKIPLSGDNLTLDLTFPGYNFISNSYYDTLGDNTAAPAIVNFTADGKTDGKVISRFESADFQTMFKTLQKWYSEGLIDKDAITHNGNGVPLTINPNVFANMSVTVPSMQNIVTNSTLQPSVYVKLMDGFTSTASLTQMTWALPVSCKAPEASMKLLNMMYTDARLVNLIDFGVEGVDYTLDANGQMQFPDGVTADTAQYYPNCYNYVTNTFLANTWTGTDPNAAQADMTAMQNSIISPLLGFSMDLSKVSDISALLDQLGHDEYGPAIFTGAATDANYNEFISKLQGAGLQTYITEAQSQVDAWMAANK